MIMQTQEELSSVAVIHTDAENIHNQLFGKWKYLAFFIHEASSSAKAVYLRTKDEAADQQKGQLKMSWKILKPWSRIALDG